MDQRAPLTNIVSPRSVVVVGASDDPTRIGGTVFRYLREDLGDAVTPVNPRRDTVQGVKALHSILEIEIVPDLAIIALPAEAVADALRECGDRGINAAIVLSGGFDEAVGGNSLKQADLVEIARRTGLRFVGPNCMGIVNVLDKVRPTFMPLVEVHQEPGHVAIVSQSGAMGVQLFEQGLEEGLSASHLCLIGNEADVNTVDLIAHLIELPKVHVVMAVVEGIKNGRGLIEVGRRALELGKPIIVMTTGGSPAGARAVISHSASMAVPDRIVDAAFDEAGILRATNPRRLLDLAKAMSFRRLPQGRRVAVLSASGGAGIHMADEAEKANVEMPVTSLELREKLGTLIPWFGSTVNPVDLTGSVLNDHSMIEGVIKILFESDEFDAVVFAAPAKFLIPDLTKHLLAQTAATGKPALVWTHYPSVARAMLLDGVATTTESSEPMAIIRMMDEFRGRREELEAEQGTTQTSMREATLMHASGVVGQKETSRLFANFNLPMLPEALMSNVDEAVAAAESMGFPIVMKLSADWMPHRSEHGAVKLNVGDVEAVRDAYRELEEVSSALNPSNEPYQMLIQPMVKSGIEMIVGARRDPGFGPFVTVGLGGVLVEIMREQQLVLAPVSRATGTRAVQRLAEGRLVGNARGLSPKACERVVDVMIALGEMMLVESAIGEVEINPLIVHGDEVVGVDSLLVATIE